MVMHGPNDRLKDDAVPYQALIIGQFNNAEEGQSPAIPQDSLAFV